MSCKEKGAESFSLIIRPALLSNVGQIFLYECSTCHRQTVAVVRDPGLLPRVWGCQANGKGTCKGYSIAAGRVPNSKNGPRPSVEFFRPRGADYRNLKSAERELVDLGILDDRVIRDQLICMG